MGPRRSVEPGPSVECAPLRRSLAQRIRKGPGISRHVGAHSQNRSWAPREGLVKPRGQIIPDVTKDANFPREPIAEREGLHAAFAFPILLGGDVLGVMEFFSREIRQPEQELLDMMATLGSQVGQFIERKRAEQAVLVHRWSWRTWREWLRLGS